MLGVTDLHFIGPEQRFSRRSYIVSLVDILLADFTKCYRAATKPTRIVVPYCTISRPKATSRYEYLEPVAIQMHLGVLHLFSPTNRDPAHTLTPNDCLSKPRSCICPQVIGHYRLSSELLHLFGICSTMVRSPVRA